MSIYNHIDDHGMIDWVRARDDGEPLVANIVENGDALEIHTKLFTVFDETMTVEKAIDYIIRSGWLVGAYIMKDGRHADPRTKRTEERMKSG